MPNNIVFLGRGIWISVAAISLFTFISVQARPLRLLTGNGGLVTPPAGGNSDSFAPIMTPDGRYIVFASSAQNLSATANFQIIPASSARLNVFIRDRVEGATALVSVNTNGLPSAQGNSLPSGVSSDGRYLLFESSAGDLVPGDTNTVSDIFLRDRNTGITRCLSVSQEGENANGESKDAVISPDGRFVSFVSSASNLVSGDTNGIADIFVRDLQLDTVALASPGATGPNISYYSDFPQITPDGRHVAFYSTATGLVANAEGSGEIYLRDLDAGKTEWISSNATLILQSTYQITNSAVSYNHVISTNGRYVAFQVSARQGSALGMVLRHDRETGETEVVHTNAFGPSTDRALIRNLSMTPDGQYIVFIGNVGSNGGTNAILVWDGNTATTKLVSGDVGGVVQPGSVAAAPMIDPNGRFVVFRHSGSPLTTNSVAGGWQLYVRDLALGTTTLVNVGTNGSSEVSAATTPCISDDGRFVAFEAFDGALVPDDRNRASDVFVRDLQENSTDLVSARDLEAPTIPLARYMALSPRSVSYDGRYIAFLSTADKITENAGDQVQDIFLKDVGTGTTKLVSINTNGVGANDVSSEPSVSANGRYVAFTSDATDLAPGVTVRFSNVYLRDMESSNVTLISSDAISGNGGFGASITPQLSADGRMLIFRSRAPNITSPPTVIPGPDLNLFLTVLTNDRTIIPLTSNGVSTADMTTDGRYVAFHGTLTMSSRQFYIWDTQAGARVYTNSFLNPRQIAISPSGKYVAAIDGNQLKVVNWRENRTLTVGPVNQSVRRHTLHFSQNEKFLAYATAESNPVIPDANGASDVYLWDLERFYSTLVSRKQFSSEVGNAASDAPCVTPDGRYVIYRSMATNLIAGQTSGEPNFYVYDRFLERTSLLSSRVSAGPNGRSFAPVMSEDGRTLVFGSIAADLSSVDQNPGIDLFQYVFLHASVTRDEEERPQIIWPAVSGESYKVQFKNSIGFAPWQPLSGEITVSGTEASITDTDPLATQRIYRVVAE